jgi:flagellar hook-length control protein FliK
VPAEALPLEGLPLVEGAPTEIAPAQEALSGSGASSGVHASALPGGALARPGELGDRARVRAPGGPEGPVAGDPVPRASETRRAGAAAGTARPEARGELERAARVIEQIRVRLADGARFASFELVPRELGRLSVRIAMHGGRLSAVVRAESERTLELLERHMPELRASLASQGIEADRLDLALGFEQSARDDFRDAPRGRRSGRGFTTRVAAEAPAGSRPTLTHDDTVGVDTYA